MLKFAFLGTSGAVQHKGSDNASLIVSHNDKHYLIDCSGGIGMKCKQLGCDLPKLAGLLITHGHIDHIYGFPSLIHQMWLLGRTEPFHIYALPEVLDLCRSLISLFGLDTKKGIFELVFVPISEGLVLNQGELSIHCQHVHHGVPALGLRFDVQGQPRLYYSGDSTFELKFAAFAEGCEIVIHEAATLHEHEETTRKKGHATAQEAGTFAERCGAKKLFMFHFDAAYEANLADFSEEAKGEFEGSITIPEPMIWYS